MKTYSAKQGEVKRGWFVVDADDQVLGRLATRIATVLRGKHKASFTRNVDAGEFVVVVNAEKVKLTGGKEEKKIYYRHSGHPGGFQAMSAKAMRAKKPEQMIRQAVWGMLPKNVLSRHLINKLKIYTGPDHPHQAQQPKPLALD